MIKRTIKPPFKLITTCSLALLSLLLPAQASEIPQPEAAPSGSVSDVIFADWIEALPPFAASTDAADGRQGLIRDIGHLLADALDKKAVFRPLPGGRIQVELIAGRVDFNCLTSPAWWAQPTEVHWTMPLFKGGEGPIMRADMADAVTTIDDLAGKTVSLYSKFKYHGPLKQLMDEERVKVLRVNSIEKALSLLRLGRTDAHIEFTSVSFHLLEDPVYRKIFKVAPLRTDTFEYSCAVADRFIPHLDTINAFIRRAQENGEIANLLRRYNFPNSELLPVSALNTRWSEARQWGPDEIAWTATSEVP